MVEPDEVLKLSGLGGIAAGMIVGLYQVLLRYPMIFGEAVASPVWMVGAHVHFLGLGLVALFYGFMISDLFEGYLWVTAIAAIVGQWGIPIVILIASGLGIPPLNALQLPLALVNIAVIVAFVVNFARRGLS